MHPRDLHSFPTRRSSDLGDGRVNHDRRVVGAGVGVVVVDAVEGQLSRYGRAGTVRAVDVVNGAAVPGEIEPIGGDRKSTRLNSSHSSISYAVFCLKKKNT